MTTLYKLTDENGRTYGDTQWAEGTVHKTNGKGDLCGPGWLHAYEHPLLAALFNPIHANFRNARLWRATGGIGKRDGELKCGATRLKLGKEIALPELSTEFRVCFAIRVALVVYQEPGFVKWANDWLSGKDRSKQAAEAADAAAWAAADAAAEAAADAADAAWAAAWAARAAAEAAEAAARAAAARAAAAAAAADAARAEPFILKMALQVADELGVTWEM